MSKARKQKSNTAFDVEFEPAMTIGFAYPVVVADKRGKLWRIDPQSGEARPVQLEQ